MIINKKGFTLLEILIAVGIFATLSAYVAYAIQNGVKAKIRIQAEIDASSRMRDALKLMEKDINLAYHFLDWEKEVQELIKKGLKTPPPQTQPGNAAEVSEVQRLDPTTHFVGKPDSLNFVTMNNAKFQANKKVADFVEVGYELKTCKSSDGKTNSQCFWRRQSGPVDLDVTVGGERLVLLENLTELKFRYLGEGQTDWKEEWSSLSSNIDEKNFFPQAVEVSMTTQKDEKAKKYSMQIVANIRFPNNRKPKAAPNTQRGAPTP
jgi:prepilin-type N-terminal cleavage/methylation domain-containing protein